MAKQASITNTTWNVLPKAPDDFFSLFPEQLPAVTQLLYNRNLANDRDIATFLNPSYCGDLHNPRLLGGIDQAVGVITEAIRRREPIVIHGDYDADGITSTAVLREALLLLGAEVDTFTPDRYVEGYGVAPATLGKLHAAGAKLVITVDCGISSAVAIAKWRRKGLKVIVTDHHQPPPDVPVAEAVINPHLPNDPYLNKHLTGVGVAFKLVQALLRESSFSAAQQEAAEKWLLDLVAIGTVADLTSLTGENRTLVRYGLLVLKKTRRPGLQALLRVAGISSEKINASCIGFALAPRLNAAGRLTHAKYALELLTTTDRRRAEQLARELNEINVRRQGVTMEAVSQARMSLPEMTDDRRVVIASGSWPSGIVGLVAGRLSQEFCRPALVIERGQTVSKGSARSIPALNIVDALRAHQNFLTTFGGHAGAAGFSLPTSKLADFQKALERYCYEHIPLEELRPELTLEAELTPSDLDWPLIEALGDFEPCGPDNRQPTFLLRQVELKELRTVGQDGSHLKLTLRLSNDQELTALAFRWGRHRERLRRGHVYDLAGNPVSNTFNRTKTLEWHVSDLRPA